MLSLEQVPEIHHLLYIFTILKITVIFIDFTGPRVVVFIHGFPEAWYSWRHQMTALAAAGYRTIAPDLRGYGLSEPHPQPENASFNDFVEDTLAILDYLQIDKVAFSSTGVKILLLFETQKLNENFYR